MIATKVFKEIIMLEELSIGLNRELERCVEELTVNIPSLLGRDHAPVDYSRVAAYEDGVKRRARFLQRILVALPQLPLELLSRDRVGVGSVVRLRDIDSGEELAYTTMVSEETQLEGCEISLSSPLGQRLLGRASD